MTTAQKLYGAFQDDHVALVELAGAMRWPISSVA
jgi:hypothetical protein